MEMEEGDLEYCRDGGVSGHESEEEWKRKVEKDGDRGVVKMVIAMMMMEV